MKYKNHIEFYNKDKKLEKKIYGLMSEFMKETKHELYSDMKILDFIYILSDFMINYFDLSEKKIGKIVNKVIAHPSRVLQHVYTILRYLETEGYEFNESVKYDMLIATMLHDIGKFVTEHTEIKDRNHNIVSYLMAKYLLDRDKTLNENDKNIILQMILMHSHKKENQEVINLYDKILRDADLFDEQCGDSLYDFLKSKIQNHNMNMNTFYLIEVEPVIDFLKSKKNIKYINERINIEENRHLFKFEFNRAMIKFSNYINKPTEIIITDEIKDYFNTNRCLNINIEF